MRQLRNLLRTYKDLIVALMLCFVGLGGFLFGVVPTIRSSISAIADVRALDAAVAFLDQKAASLDALSEDSLRDQLSVITAAIPTDKAVPGIFATVDRVAATTGVTVVDMAITQAGSLSTASAQNLSTEEKTPGAFVVPLSMTIKGSYDAIRGFVGRVGLVRRLLRVRNLDITVISAGEVQVGLSLDALYMPLPAALAKADQALAELTREEEDTIAKLASYPLVLPGQAGTLRQPTVGTKQNPFAR